MAQVPIMGVPGLSQLNFDNRRFLELEQRVSDMETILDAMKELLNANNATLQAIMDAVEKEQHGN